MLTKLPSPPAKENETGTLAQRSLPWLVIVGGWLLTYYVWSSAQHFARHELRDEFNLKTQEIVTHIEERMDSQEKLLLSVRSLFNASIQVDREEFREFFNSMEPGKNFPGIQGVGFAIAVQPADKDKHIAAIRKEGFPEYTIRPPGERKLYTSILYLEPFDSLNKRAFGYDMYSEPVRHVAMMQARDTGEATNSGKVRLVQEETVEKPQPGFLMYVPVYKNGLPHDTLETRRANLVGWVYSPFRMHDLIHGTLGNYDPRLDIEIYDGTSMSDESLMYASPQASGKPDPNPLFAFKTVMRIAGHDWTVAVRTRPSFEPAGHWQKATIVAFAGAAISLLLGLLTWFLIHGRAQALKIAGKMTRELSESEKRFRSMANSAPVLIWVAGADNQCNWFNQVWLDFTGRTMEQEIRSTWEEKIHPDDYDRYAEIYRSHFAQRKDFHAEYRLRQHDGEYRWVDGHAVPRFDTSGEFLGYIGSCLDITPGKEIAIQLQQTLESLRNQSSRLQTILETASDGIHILDEQGFVIQFSDSFARMLGYSREEVAGMNMATWSVQLPPEEIPAALKQLTAEPVAIEDKHRRKDGSIIDVEINVKSIELEGKRFLYASSRDITERKKTAESLRLAAMVFESTSEAMFVTDADDHIVAVNPAFTVMAGYTEEEVIGKNPRILNSGRQDKAFYEAMWKALNATGTWHGEIWNRRKNGEVFPEWLTLNTIYNKDGSINRRIALFSDITEKKKSDKLIWEQAHFDALTGLPNRRMVHDRLDVELKKSRRAGLPLAVLFLDLDRFKEVNDTLGHEMGDILLQEAARRMTSCVRASDTVGRLGGDEFILILGELADAGSVERIANMILAKLAAPFQLGSETAYITASIGITLYPDDGTDITTLLKNADQAMYAAKHAGRNRFHYYTPAMQKIIDIRMQRATDLHTALPGNQFRMYYQPVADLQTGDIYKAEALIRWQHPRLGLISPADFIPIAEETGLIVDIGNWVFHQAAAQSARWRALCHPEFQISFNMSPLQFKSDAGHHASWFNYLDQLGVDARSVVAEITEGLLMEASEATATQLHAFRDKGMQVALDDFGTGYSSLSYIKKFGIDYLKIDQSFVRDLANSSSDLVLCEAIVAMAHKLGIKVIAEGVETQAQCDLLKGIGCDYGQGYLFSMPLPAEEFEKMMHLNGAKKSGSM